MAKILVAKKPSTREKLVMLKELKVSDTFRRRNCSFQDALKGKDEECFWQVLPALPTTKPGRVRVMSIDCKIELEFDDFHEVIPHNIIVTVEEAEQVPIES